MILYIKNELVIVENEEENIMSLEKELQDITNKTYHKKLSECNDKEAYDVLLSYVKNQLEMKTQIQGNKKLYYVSAEFLIGKLLSNNLINLGIYQEVKEVLHKNGLALEQIEECENEPSLGNGGLGRLAACFLDSIATLGLCGDGVGLNYHLGLFKQHFQNNKQEELPNEWIEEKSWLERTSTSYTVRFRDFDVKSTLYRMDIIGYHGQKNYLNLFDLDSVDEHIVEKGIQFHKEDILRNLTLFLYPDDSDEAGKKLRLYQQYFLVSNAAQMIIDEVKEKKQNVKELHKYVAIQINDTHPSLIIPEMIRLLMKEGLTLKQAIDEVTLTCAYTNHTILAEALEKWPVHYLLEVVPHLYPIIMALDAIACERSDKEEVRIIDKNQLVHMAHMDIHFSMSTNGVAAIHTDILKDVELHDFYELYPEKFNNKTNGITFRRWLLNCNEELTAFIDSLIGESYKSHADDLEKLLAYINDQEVIKQLQDIKYQKKVQLSQYLKKHQNIELNPDSIYDIQIKRLHEYKRQQMNVLYIIYKYLQIKSGIKPSRPISIIFGAKAAPAYILAKDIIHAILCLQELIQQDKDVSQYLQVIMVENYNVTAAQKLIPACDISEQISLASKEASGTGNMKLMLNGAITLGTDDGANVEIHDLVGDDNIYIFGAKSDEVIAHYKHNDYDPIEFYNKDSQIKEIVDFLISNEMLNIGDKIALQRLYDDITTKDWFMTLLDLKDYIQTKDKIFADYENKEAWGRKMLINIAKAGYFTSDRTIEQYNEDIWKLKS